MGRLEWCCVAALSCTGCMYWQAQDGPPAQVLAKRRSEVNLVLTDGTEQVVRQPHVVRGAADGEHVVGLVGPSDAPIPLSIPVERIHYIEAEAMNPVTSGLAILGIFFGIAAIGFMVDPPFSDDTR